MTAPIGVVTDFVFSFQEHVMSVNRILGVVLMGLGLATYAQAQDGVPAGVKKNVRKCPRSPNKVTNGIAPANSIKPLMPTKNKQD